MVFVLFSIFILYLLWTQKNHKWFCVVLCLFLFLISALKGMSATSDLMSYENAYYRLEGKSFRNLLIEYLSGEQKDFGFYAIAKVFSLLGFSVEIWKGAIALFFAICASVFIYRDSEEPFISAIMLFAFYYGFTLSGLRQTMAMGIILLSFKYIKERKLIKYLILVVIATLFHSSALIFLPAYWLVRMKLGLKQIVLIIISFAICVFAPSIVRILLSIIAWNESVGGYADTETKLNWSGYIIQVLIFAFCLLFRWNWENDFKLYNKPTDSWINLMVIGLCLQGASVIIAEAFRVSYYYSMASMLALPNIVQLQKDKTHSVLLWVVPLLLILYMLISQSYIDLTFFWQG